MVIEMIFGDLVKQDLIVVDMKCLWLYQVNINMNQMIVCKVFDCDFELYEVLVVLDEFVNIVGVGFLVVFYCYNDDFQFGEKGLICFFGVGYFVGLIYL